MADGQTRVILVTMVKNESAIIKRMLGSVVQKLDGIVVVDTGSTDNTVDLAKNFIAQSGKPGDVLTTPWVNFGVSRTQSLAAARRWVKDTAAWPLQNTWALLIDGDMVLEGEVSRDRLAALAPSVDGIMLNQKQNSLVYRNIRLIRFAKEIQCIGATHEYWNVHNRTSWDDPYINDIGDGGSKADKFPRDARLLEAELVLAPKHDRTLFYLGQTYKCLSRWQDAITMLERRVEVGGWDEEVYMALVYIGECHEHLKNDAAATHAWLRAWQMCPGRTEAGMCLVEFYRKKPDMQFIAMMFLEKVMACQGFVMPIAAPAKKDYSLFINHRKASHDMWMELAILAFYSDHKSDAFAAIDAALLKKELDWKFRNTLLGYQKWYDTPLPTMRLKRVRLPAELAPWRGESDASIWESYNPSIRLSGNGYEATLRCANYWTTDAKTWPQRGRAPNIITRTVVCHLTPELTVASDPAPFELQIPAAAIVKADTTVQGIEDVRMMAGTTKQILSGNSPQISHYDKPQVCFMGYDLSGAVSLEVRETPFGPTGQCQKNWLPFDYAGTSAYVYSISPFLVYDFDNTLLKTWHPTAPFTLDNLRGGAAPVPWNSAAHPDEAYVMVTHFCHYHDGRRRYWSRFITLKSDLTPARLSRMFRFTTSDIEYVSTMSPSLDGNYLLGMGVNESECWVAEVDPKVIDAILLYTI
jgi:glycosyltransferase involved in cell wall biosynthesis